MNFTPVFVAICLVLSVARAADNPPPAVDTPIQQLKAEIDNGLARRGLESRFAELEAFIADRLDASAGTNSWSDKTGGCRLDWFDHLLRHPRQAIVEAEQFTRDLHSAAKRETGGLTAVLDIAADKLLPAGDHVRSVTQFNDPDPLLRMQKIIRATQAAYQRSVARLTRNEQDELRTMIQAMSAENGFRMQQSGGRLNSRRMAALLEKMDRGALLDAARLAAQLADPDLLAALAHVLPAPSPAVPGVKGTITRVLQSPDGWIVVGGMGPNEYQLDRMTNVCAVVDQGGDDLYVDGTLSAHRPVLAIIDLAGNDTYRGTKPGIQGGAILGVSVLIDVAGNDTYEAQDVAQGSAFAGVGLLLDLNGNDRYRGRARVQGHATGGVGVLIDRAGNDDYHAALLAQGVGGPLGFGLLDDLAGNDHYYAGGLYPSPYDDTPGFAGFSQGVGVGWRGAANGGIGVLLDGGGDDIYEADYFSHGGGYWFAAGFARDFGGNDQRLGSTRTAFDGSERKPGRFLRYGIAFGCHYALGFVFDDDGDDTYYGDMACLGLAWDVGVAALVDFRGNDHYEVTSSAEAMSYNAGLAVLFDGDGDDVYVGGDPGYADPKDEYHPNVKSGGNFAFLIDLGGKDKFSGGFTNQVDLERGWPGGFLIHH